MPLDAKEGAEPRDVIFRASAPAEVVLPRRLVAGDGALARLGDVLRSSGVAPGPVLVVADAALVELGVTARADEPLRAAGYEPAIRSGITGEPDLAVAEAVVAGVRERPFVAVVGIGGGSALDPAKLAAGLATNEGPVEAYLRGRQIAQPALPLALIPTTAGTGAEASKNTIITHEGRKFVVSSPLLSPALALLDPTLTVSCPRGVTAASGMDALAHAVEATLSFWATPFTTFNALSAVRTIGRWLRIACDDGASLPARRAMLNAAHLAGLAINASTLLGHSMAYTVATRAHLPHGATTAMTLPYCVAYDAPGARAQVEVLGFELGVEPAHLPGWLRALASDLGMPGSLREVGIGEEQVPAMVEECMRLYPRPNNPVPFDEARLTRLYLHFLDGDVDAAAAEAQAA